MEDKKIDTGFLVTMGAFGVGMLGGVDLNAIGQGISAYTSISPAIATGLSYASSIGLGTLGLHGIKDGNENGNFFDKIAFYSGAGLLGIQSGTIASSLCNFVENSQAIQQVFTNYPFASSVAEIAVLGAVVTSAMKSETFEHMVDEFKKVGNKVLSVFKTNENIEELTNEKGKMIEKKKDKVMELEALKLTKSQERLIAHVNDWAKKNSREIKEFDYKNENVREEMNRFMKDAKEKGFILKKDEKEHSLALSKERQRDREMVNTM